MRKCEICKGKRVIYVSSIKTYKRTKGRDATYDLGWFEPCKCQKKSLDFERKESILKVSK